MTKHESLHSARIKQAEKHRQHKMVSSSVVEKVFFENADTKVTSLEFFHYSESHLIKNILSTRISEETPSESSGMTGLLVRLLYSLLMPLVVIFAVAITDKKTYKIIFSTPNGDVVGFSTTDPNELYLVDSALNEAINEQKNNANLVG